MRDVIIACDFSSQEETLQFLDQFNDRKPFVKIGMELYYSCGPQIVTQIKERGHKIFLDLKLHDIPNTVYRAMKQLASLQVDMVNVHASGTIEMMKAAQNAIDEVHPETLLIAVTQLTSTSQKQMNSDLLIEGALEDVVVHYAQNAQRAGLAGVVCSPLEARMIKENTNNHFITVTPGIRFSSSVKDDQKRITTPALAKEIGSDYIVVGRPITQADNPVEVYLTCVKEFCDE